MIQENELIMLLIGIGVMALIIRNHGKLKKLPSSNLFLGSFMGFFVGWLSTVVEGFFLNQVFNLIEHFSYMAGAILAALWCWTIFSGKKEKTDEYYRNY